MKNSNSNRNNGSGGLAIHLNKKLIQGVGNGTFTQGKTWKGVLLNTSPTAVTIQNWFVVDTEGWKMVTSVWIQSGYLLIMLCITHSSLYALLSSKKKREKRIVSCYKYNSHCFNWNRFIFIAFRMQFALFIYNDAVDDCIVRI